MLELDSWIFFGPQNSKNPIHQMIYEYMEKRREHVLVKTYQEAVQRVMDSNYAFIGESISQDLAAARHCNLIRAPEVIGARGFGIATAQGQSPSPSAAPCSLGGQGQPVLLVRVTKRARQGHCSVGNQCWHSLGTKTHKYSVSLGVLDPRNADPLVQ